MRPKRNWTKNKNGGKLPTIHEMAEEACNKMKYSQAEAPDYAAKIHASVSNLSNEVLELILAKDDRACYVLSVLSMAMSKALVCAESSDEQISATMEAIVAGAMGYRETFTVNKSN